MEMMTDDIRENEKVRKELSDLVLRYFTPDEYGTDWVRPLDPFYLPRARIEPSDDADTSWIQYLALLKYKSLYQALYEGSMVRINVIPGMRPEDVQAELRRMCRERVELMIQRYGTLGISHTALRRTEMLDKLRKQGVLRDSICGFMLLLLAFFGHQVSLSSERWPKLPSTLSTRSR